MQETSGYGLVNLGLDAIIWFKETDEEMSCIVRGVTPDCLEADVVIPNVSSCAGGDVKLNIFLPNERTPVKCTGGVTEDSEENNSSGDPDGCLVHLMITPTSRIDHRRLELFVTQRRAFISGGHRSV
jgi:hypothetical protein